MSTVGEILAFLAANAPLIEAIEKAIAAGASADSIKAAIEQAEVSASDAAMKEELGLPQV